MTFCHHAWNLRAALLTAVVGFCMSACSHASGDGAAATEGSGAASGAPRPAVAESSPGSVASAPQDPLAAFERVRAVLQDPRCQNCHPPGDAPLQGNEGRAHDQNVLRGPDGQGPPGEGCSTCHGPSNLPASYGPNMPPGAPGWHMPPPEVKMVFVGLSSAPLCQQLKDSKRNGGKDLAALLHHVSDDPLVLWGWSPGLGRRPVGVPHEEFVAAFRAWASAGAPCPP
jgi:hypothetical protein